MDEFKLAFVPHPNDEVAEATHPVESLRSHVGNGLIMVPPEEGWRALVLAADCIIGDHGSVTFTAAAIGVPVLLASFGFTGMPPDVPLARFGRSAPRFAPDEPAAAQIRAAVEAGPVEFDYTDALAEPEPGAPFLLTEAIYRLIGLDAPEPTVPEPLPDPTPVPEYRDTSAWRCRMHRATEGTVWERRPFSVFAGGEGHVAADMACRDARIRSAASVLLLRDPLPRDDAAELLRTVMDEYPVCVVAGASTGDDEALIAMRDGPILHVRAPARQLDLIPSALYERLREHPTDPLGITAAEAREYLQRCFQPGPAVVAAESQT